MAKVGAGLVIIRILPKRYSSLIRAGGVGHILSPLVFQFGWSVPVTKIAKLTNT